MCPSASLDGAIRPELLDGKLLVEIFSARSAVSTVFLNHQSIEIIRAESRAALSGAEKRARFVARVLPGAQHLSVLLTQTDDIDLPINQLAEFVINSGSSLGKIVWLLKGIFCLFFQLI